MTGSFALLSFPIKNEVVAYAMEGIGVTWKTQVDGFSPIVCGIGADHGGPGGAYTTPDFVGTVMISGIIAAFKVICAQLNLSFHNIEARAIVTTDLLSAEQIMWIKHIEVFLTVDGASHVEEVRKILEQSINISIGNNLIKSGKTFHIDVH